MNKIFLIFIFVSNLYAQQDLYFTAKDGIKLRYKVFSTSKKESNIVIFLHGRNRYIDLYTDFYNFLNNKGVKVYAMDLRGHGLSEGHRCSINSYDQYTSDLNNFINLIKKENKSFSLKYTLITHSTGGLIAVNYLRQYGEANINKLVLLAPFLGLTNSYSPWLVFAYMQLKIWIGDPHKQIKNYDLYCPFEKNDITHDKIKYEELVKSNLACGKPTPAWIYQSIKAIKQAENVKDLQVQIKMLLAEKDTVINNKSAEAFCLRQTNCSLKIMPAMFHDLLIESDRDKLYINIY